MPRIFLERPARAESRRIRTDFGVGAVWIGKRWHEPKSIAAMIQVKRVYQKPSRKDGLRILVDRLWPRGLTKERAAVKLWLKDVAPSTALRKWFGHDPAKWKQFQARYRKDTDRVDPSLCSAL